MAAIDDLITARDNIAARIKEMTTNFKPTYTVDGRTFQWGELLSIYMKSLSDLKLQIASEEGPFSLESTMLP